MMTVSMGDGDPSVPPHHPERGVRRQDRRDLFARRAGRRYARTAAACPAARTPIAWCSPRKNRAHNLRAARCLSVIRAGAKERRGAGSISPTRAPEPANHLDRRFDDLARGSGHARQGPTSELDLDQFDDPVLGTNVGRLNGLEEEVLGSMLAVGGRDRQRRLKYARLGEAQPHPGPGLPSLAAGRGNPAVEHPADDFLARLARRNHGLPGQPRGGLWRVVAVTLMAICF